MFFFWERAWDERVAYLGKGKSQREGGFLIASLAALRIQLERSSIKRDTDERPLRQWDKKLTAIIVQITSGEARSSTTDSTDK